MRQGEYEGRKVVLHEGREKKLCWVCVDGFFWESVGKKKDGSIDTILKIKGEKVRSIVADKEKEEMYVASPLSISVFTYVAVIFLVKFFHT